MNERTAVRPHRTPSTPARTGLLQRRCACGGTPGPSGECAECRRKRRSGLKPPGRDRTTPSVTSLRALTTLSCLGSAPATTSARCRSCPLQPEHRTPPRQSSVVAPSQVPLLQARCPRTRPHRMQRRRIQQRWMRRRRMPVFQPLPPVRLRDPLPRNHREQFRPRRGFHGRTFCGLRTTLCGGSAGSIHRGFRRQHVSGPRLSAIPCC